MRRETRIGRKLDNDLVIQDVLVSREHAKVIYEEGQFVAYDLESTGGTFINNKKISKGVLYTGDELSLASVTVTFVHDAPDMENQAGKRTGSLS
ncbi:MAG: FHA domain-containing protein [Chloroflexi bacterium]|nr:FHA domain-containing protein [Chloroflexota bacterium]